MKVRSFAAAAIVLVAGEALAAPSATECISANESSIRLRKEKKLLEAREKSAVCADAACPAEIRDECSQKLIETTAAIPTLVLSAKDASGNDLVAVRVTMDGVSFVDRLDGTAVPVNPGPHVFRFETAGQAIDKTIVLREGDRDRHAAIRFGVATTEGSVRDPGRRTAGIVVGAAGVVGLGFGVVAAIVAAGLSKSSQNECKLATACDGSAYAHAQRDYNAAVTWSHVSEAGFAVGGVALVVGGILFFTAPYVTPGKTTGFGLDVGGRF
jgi:hypothetical protein